jgi:dTDP-glucose 4,6-dehydratase
MSSRLLTGGAGFIGSNFVRSWFESGGGALVNLDKLTYAGNSRNLIGLPLGAQHAFIHDDFVDRDLAARLRRSTKSQ